MFLSIQIWNSQEHIIFLSGRDALVRPPSSVYPTPHWSARVNSLTRHLPSVASLFTRNCILIFISIFNCHFQFSIARVNSLTQDLLSVASLSTRKCIFNPIWWLMCVDILRCSSLFGGVIKNLFFTVRLTLRFDPPPLLVIFSKPDSKKPVFLWLPTPQRCFPRKIIPQRNWEQGKYPHNKWWGVEGNGHC